MSDTTLGELLVVLGVLTEEQRMVAMQAQRVSSKPMTFGEILVALRYCTQEQVEDAAALQERLRSKKAQIRAAATYDVAQRSKAVLRTVRRQLILTGESIIEKASPAGASPAMLRASLGGG